MKSFTDRLVFHHLPTKMILGTYWPSGDRCLSVVSYCWNKTHSSHMMKGDTVGALVLKCLNSGLCREKTRDGPEWWGVKWTNEILWCRTHCRCFFRSEDIPLDWGWWSPHPELAGSQCSRQTPSSVLQEEQGLKYFMWGKLAPPIRTHRDVCVSVPHRQIHHWLLYQQMFDLWKGQKDVVLPWLCGQSSRWKRTIRGLFLQTHIVCVTIHRQPVHRFSAFCSYLDLDQ